MKITHHYKSIISALAALALFYSAAPRAGILDGGEIQFHGLVTDEAPKWTWQVGSPDQTWAVDTADARTESGQLVFDLRGKGSLPFLEGHLYEVAERGGPGFTPFITFSSNGQPFSVTAGGSTTAQHFRASVPVVAQEKKPLRFLETDHSHDSLSVSDSLTHRLSLPWFLKDISGLHYDRKNRRLYVLSHESALVLVSDPEGGWWVMPLRRGHSGLERDIPQAEGIASDGRNSLWIVSEPDRFYRFSRTTTS
ncbi:SdiA-regulated domain-containing protein [Salmonella enterica]|nr:SdiA-regulated domain-containing protein [Salmonella enterica]